MLNFFAILVSQARYYCNLYLLSFIVTMYWTKFCLNYIQIVVFLYLILGSLFCVNNWLSLLFILSAILIVFCTFKFGSMTPFLSLLLVHWILCYRIKNISFMVFIKQLKPRIFVQCNYCYTEWSLAFQGEDCGFESPPWDWKFFFLPFFSSTSFLPFLTLHVYPVVCVSVGRVLCVYLVGLLTIDFDHKHSSGRILGLW